MKAEWITLHAAVRLGENSFFTFAKGSMVVALQPFPREEAVKR